MKLAAFLMAAIAISACQKEEPKAPQFRLPNVAECKRAVDIASQAAMLISFETGKAYKPIKRIWELTDDPIERMHAQQVVDIIFIAHSNANEKVPNVKAIKDGIELFNENCNTFELK